MRLMVEFDSVSGPELFHLFLYRGFKPIAASYFAIAAPNASEQFLYFVTLVSWLLALNNHQVKDWSKYDDPQTTSQNILLELQKLGIEMDIAPTKIKAGYGDGVC